MDHGFHLEQIWCTTLARRRLSGPMATVVLGKAVNNSHAPRHTGDGDLLAKSDAHNLSRCLCMIPTTERTPLRRRYDRAATVAWLTSGRVAAFRGVNYSSAPGARTGVMPCSAGRHGLPSTTSSRFSLLETWRSFRGRFHRCVRISADLDLSLTIFG